MREEADLPYMLSSCGINLKSRIPRRKYHHMRGSIKRTSAAQLSERLELLLNNANICQAVAIL